MPSCIKSTLYLRTTKATIAKHSTIFACKWYTLCYALVYNITTYFCQAMHIAFSCTIVATFDSVVKQTVNAISIILIIFCSIYTTLCGNAMCTTRRILEAKRFYIVAQLCQSSSSRCTSQASTYNYNINISFISRIYKFAGTFILAPLFIHIAYRHFAF